MSHEIHPRVEKFLNRCIYPFVKRGRILFIHPDDIIIFAKTIYFLEGAQIAKVFPKKMYRENLGGLFMGHSIYLQDDMQILLLAMNGGKSVWG